MIDILIKNGTIVTAEGCRIGDIAVRGEKIVAITDPGEYEVASRTIDAEGLFVVPGAIDTHSHIEEEFKGVKPLETWTQATRNAAVGGVTMVLNFINQAKGKTMVETVEDEIERINKMTCIDYNVHPVFIYYDDNDEVVAQLPVLKEMGIPSIKAFTVYDEGGFADDYSIYRLMRGLAELGGVLGVHAENKSLTEQIQNEFIARGETGAEYYAATKPPIIEAEATHRICMLAEATGCRTYLVHMSCKEAADIVASFQARGLPIYGETCGQYLTMTEEKYLEPYGFREFITPPLRHEEDQERLFRAIREGTIQIYGSDHCPFGKDAKDDGYYRSGFTEVAYGGVGLLENVPMLFAEGVLKGRISAERFVEITSTNPAKLFGLYPQKGTLSVGSDADIVLFDPNKEVTLGTALYDNVDWTAYEGRKITGFPVVTIQRGKILVDHGEFYGCAGEGKFLPGELNEEVLSTIR